MKFFIVLLFPDFHLPADIIISPDQCSGSEHWYLLASLPDSTKLLCNEGEWDLKTSS